jgi:hypothetical protein
MSRLALLIALLAACSCLHRERAFLQPEQTVLLHFSERIRYVLELEVDGRILPVEYSGRNRLLLIEGLQPGPHHLNLRSISYVFGPEFTRFDLAPGQRVEIPVLSRRYRSVLPKKKEQISIRAYRKALAKEEGSVPPAGGVRARFQ